MKPRSHLWLFFAVTYAFTWLFWIPQALLARGVALPAGLAAFLSGPFNPAAFGPLVGAVVLTWAQDGWRGVLALLRRGVDLRFPKRWLAAALLLPLVIFGGGVLASIAAGFRPLDLSVITNPPYAIVAFFVILLTGGPLQEEFGWRGYALPRLQERFRPDVAGLILGFFWWLWHLPAVFVPGRFMADSLPVFLALAVVIMLTSVLFARVYNGARGSVLSTLLMHTSLNWSLWAFMPDMRMDLPTAGFLIAFLIVAVLLVARNGARE